MRFAHLFLMLSTGLMAQTPVVLKAARVGHVLVLKDVFLNGTGPFRMMIDTGNSSSLIRPGTARRLGVRPAYAVNQVTVAGVRRLPVAVLDQVTTGAMTERAVEAMIGDVRFEGVDGVLGQSWLVRHDYLLDYRNCRVVIDAAPPEGGLSMALHSTDGRPLVNAQVDGRHLELALDSGTPVVVLSECAGRAPQQATLLTNGASIRATEVSTKIALPGDRERHMRAMCVNSLQPAPGLLPASAFSEVFVSNRDGLVRLRQ
ncbi:MAG: retropepsin-like aspartic protease [Bryobacteraceae bacterium]